MKRKRNRLLHVRVQAAYLVRPDSVDSLCGVAVHGGDGEQLLGRSRTSREYRKY